MSSGLSVEAKPLKGRRIVLTRPDDAAGDALQQRLLAWGAAVSLIPLVEITPVAFVLPDAGAFDWIFWTSQNAVRAVFGQEPVPAAFRQARSAVVGPSTAALLQSYRANQGSEPAFVSPRFDAESAATAFCEVHDCTGLRILWPCGNRANQRLLEILSAAGARVTPCVVYETQTRSTLLPVEMDRLKDGVDLLVFTSPSAVEAFQALSVDGDWRRPAIACLGPRTAQSAQAVFGRVNVQPEPSTFDALGEAICQFYSNEETI